jgi:hypothetical protein
VNENADRSGGKKKFSSNENKFNFSRIASKEKSQVQMLHSDYSPLENGYEYETIKKIKDKDGIEREVKQEKGPWYLYNYHWEKYEFFSLSALYFPEGGLLHLIECFPDVIIMA